MRPKARRATRWPLVLLLVVAAIAGLGLTIRQLQQASPAAVATAPESSARDAGPGDLVFDRLFREGVSHLQQGDAHRAAVAFEAARQRQPHVAETYVNLGFAYLDLKVPQAARAAFERAISLQPTQVNALYGLAESEEQLGDIDAALGAMRSFAHLTSDDDPYRRRAMAAIWEWSSQRRDGTGAAQTSAPPATEAGPAETSVSPPQTTAVAEAAERAMPPIGRLGNDTRFLEAYRGRTVVLNVWATWCAPCRAELPSLQRLSERLDESRFAVLGLSIDQDPDYVREFLRDLGVRYANYIDPGDGVAAGQLGVDSIPQTLIIGPDGRIRERHVGLRQWDGPDIVGRLEGPEQRRAPSD